MAKRGRIRLYFEGEERDLAASSKRAEAAIGGVDDATKRYNKTADEQAVAVDRVNKRNFELTSSARSVRREQDSLVKSLHDVNIRFTSMQNLIGLVKWPALITGAGYAAQGLGTAAAGATALTSALGPLSAALSAYPALLGAVGQAAGVLALTQMGDLKEALGGNEEAMKRLSPQAKHLLGVVKGMEPEFKRLRSSVQEKLFAGLSLGVKIASSNFGVLQRILGRTAGTLGYLAQRAGALLGSKAFGRDLQTIGEGNARVLGRMGVAGLKLSSALRHVMVVAQPFLMWLTGSAVKLADWIDGAAEAGRESGRMAGFFERSREVMERLGSIAQSLGAGLLAVGHAAAPLGRQILGALDIVTQGFEDWTSSIEGKNALRDYFAQAKPGIFEMGRLVGDLGAAFLRLSNDKGFFTLTHSIRTELVPVLEEVVGNTTQAFGPHLVSALVQIAKLFGHIAGSSGPLVGFVDGIGGVVSVINTLLDTLPGLNGFVVTLAGAVAVSKAMKFTAAATGVTTLIGLFKDLRTAALGAAAAEQVVAAPGVLGGLGKRGGLKGIVNSKGGLGGLLGLGATAATTVGPLGMLSGAEVAGVTGSSVGGGLLAAAPAAGPWLALAAAIAATGAGLVLLYKHSKTFRDLVAPLGQAASGAFDQIKAEVAPLGKSLADLGAAFSGREGIAGELKELYPQVKGPLEAIGNLLRSVWLRGLQSVFDRAAQAIRGFGQGFAGTMQVLRGVIEVISGVLTLKFGKAWQGVKDIFGGSIKTVLGYFRAMVSPVTSTAKAVGGVLGDVFGNAWERVKGIFRDGANAVVGFVQKIANVINLIPGIPDIHVGSEKDQTPPGIKGPVGANRRYSGGPITRPMAIVGEEAPQHHEWVIATNPRYRKNNVAYWMQAGRDLGIPGFFGGGNIAGAVGGVAGKGADFFIDKLPKPDLPSWIAGLGSYAVSHVADYIRDGFQEMKFGNLSVGSGVLGYAGPPANMKQLGDPRWVDSHTLAVAAYLAKKFGLSISSSYRDPAHNAAVGGVAGSLHTHGSSQNPGAIDFVPPSAAALAFARSHVAGLEEAMIHDVGSGLHIHLGFFAGGGKINWSKLVGSSWDVDELATLAHIVGAPNPGLMGAISFAESRGDEDAVNHNSNGTVDEGLWQINSIHGFSNLRDPLANAQAMKSIVASQGLGAWVTYNEGLVGGKGKVSSPLAGKIRAAIAGKPVGGDGAGTKARDFTFGLARQPVAISLPGLKASAAPAGAEGLPPAIQGLFKQPGLSFASKLGIAEMASTLAGTTVEPSFDEAGNETSADTHADDIAAARVLRGLVLANKRRIEKRLREIAKRLKQKGLSQKARNRLLAEQARLLTQLGGAKSSLQGFNSTINAPPDEPELEVDVPTAMDFASRDLALAELTPGLEDDQAARRRMLQIAEEQLAVALQTADPRDDIEAAQNVKALREAVEANNEILRQREEFEKERLALDKRLANLAETQGPAFMAAFVSWIDGAIGGPVMGRSQLATAGVSAGYQ